ncbi:MAG: ribonuclease P protein component [Anaerolineae bacterium]|nr:ribonuclease P protein component [Anaerolineae bacterium]
MRLRRPADFERVRQDGHAYHHRWVIFSVRPNGLGRNRYGIITSKRLGKAVARNRVRRLLREALRLSHPELQAGFDIVVVARPAIVGQPFEAIRRIIRELAAQSGVLWMESDRA